MQTAVKHPLAQPTIARPCCPLCFAETVPKKEEDEQAHAPVAPPANAGNASGTGSKPARTPSRGKRATPSKSPAAGGSSGSKGKAAAAAPASSSGGKKQAPAGRTHTRPQAKRKQVIESDGEDGAGSDSWDDADGESGSGSDVEVDLTMSDGEVEAAAAAAAAAERMKKEQKKKAQAASKQKAAGAAAGEPAAKVRWALQRAAWLSAARLGVPLHARPAVVARMSPQPILVYHLRWVVLPPNIPPSCLPACQAGMRVLPAFQWASIANYSIGSIPHFLWMTKARLLDFPRCSAQSPRHAQRRTKSCRQACSASPVRPACRGTVAASRAMPAVPVGAFVPGLFQRCLGGQEGRGEGTSHHSQSCL